MKMVGFRVSIHLCCVCPVFKSLQITQRFRRTSQQAQRNSTPTTPALLHNFLPMLRVSGPRTALTCSIYVAFTHLRWSAKASDLRSNKHDSSLQPARSDRSLKFKITPATQRAEPEQSGSCQVIVAIDAGGARMLHVSIPYSICIHFPIPHQPTNRL